MQIEEKTSIYLNEGRTKGVDIDFARNFIEKRCQKSIKGTPIWRGIQDYTDDYLYVDPAKSSKRTSAFADYNYYNMLLSNLPSWKDYPPRDKSLVCTTSYDNAEHRQNGDFPFRVLPVDGARIGVCNECDIWEGFKITVRSSMQGFNRSMYELFDRNGVKTRNTDMIYSTFVKACNEIDKIKDEGEHDIDIGNNWHNKEWVIDYRDGESKLIDFLDFLLSPGENYFRLVTSGAKIPMDREVWTDGESILIRADSDLYTEIFGKFRI